MTFIGRLFTITALALGLSAGVHTAAIAQPADKPAEPAPTPEQLEAAKAAFLEGKSLFDAKKFDLAVEKFKESYRLSRNPLLLYNVAFTFDQLGQKDMAHFYYSKFLADAPADAAQRGDVTARLKVLDKELARDTTPPPGDTTTPPPGDTTTPPPDGGGRKPRKPASAYTAEDFQHQIVEDAPPGRPLDLTAFVPEEVGWQVTMFYRGGGDAKFTSVTMKPRYNELVGRIPAKLMAGSSVQYYLEVRNAAGEMITRVGRPASPNIVYIDPKAKPRYYPDLTDERDWVEPSGGGGSSSGGGGASSGGGGSSSYVPGGYFDAGSTKFKRAKWITTGVAVAGLGASLTFYMLAANMSATLESEAALSNSTSRCDGQPKPCRTFNADRQAIELAGQRNELVSKVTFGFGIAFTGVAAYFWYKDVTAGPRAEKTAATGLDSLIAAPVAGSDFLGGTAAVRF